MKQRLFFFFFITSTIIFSQEITGIVLDKRTNLPVENVAIYFDNTTKGVITNRKGFFSITYREDVNTPLVISFLGYKKIIFENYEPNKKYKFLLEEETSTLDEVLIVAKDPWTRKLKLKYFREQFLGKTKNAKSCVIQNEDDIQLYFNKKKNQLTARSRKPIIIINKNLNYKLQYDLQDFEVNFKSYHAKVEDSTIKPKRKYFVQSVYYSGTTFFSDHKEENSEKIFKKRDKAFKGSSLHFMRALANYKLEEEGFIIVSNGFQVAPENYIYRNKLEVENMVEVKFLKRLEIVYKKEKTQSFIVPTSEKFTIDALGNFSPIRSLHFGGHMGANRVGDIVPLNYKIEAF